MHQERGKESEEGFKASYAGSKVASRMLCPPGTEHCFGGMGDLSGHKKGSGTKKKKTEPVVYPEPDGSQGREGMDEKLVLALTLR